MQRLTHQAWQEVLNLSQRFEISTDSVMSLLEAVKVGNGSMAQFQIQELGGSGQWMRGGMTMVGDMFNSGLKTKVDQLCNDLSNLLARHPFVADDPSVSSAVSGHWWPSDLGAPNASGGQNNVRYAYFSKARRLALAIDGHVTLYDTLDNQIGGVSQQQGSGGSLTFTSQHGPVDLTSLPLISVDQGAAR